MRVLFSSLPSHGHTYPLLPLAQAVAAAGHRVRYATAAGFLPVVSRFGFETSAVGISMHEAFTDPRLAAVEGARGEGAPGVTTGPEAMQARAFRVFGEILPPVFAADLAPVIAEFEPDLLVGEVLNVGAGIAAFAAGVPFAWHGFSRLTPTLAGMLRAGLAAGLRGRVQQASERALAAVPFVDVCPPSLADPGFAAVARSIPLRPQAVRIPGEEWAPAFDGDRPLLYLTLGTTFGSAQVLRAAMEGLSRLDANVLVAAGPSVDPTALDNASGNVRVEAWVAQAAVLDRADLIAHHGGAGTTLGAAAAGVPQLFLPQGADQFVNAAMITEAGAGRRLVAEEVTADRVAAQASALLTDPALRAAARRLAEEIAGMPSPAEVVGELAALART